MKLIQNLKIINKQKILKKKLMFIFNQKQNNDIEKLKTELNIKN